MNIASIYFRANHLTVEQEATVQQASSWLQEHAISHLRSDARQVGVGDAFVAYAFDEKHDGRAYVAQAGQAHASAIVWQNDGVSIDCAVSNLGVAQLNLLAGHIAHVFYAQPSDEMRMVAITGTNGKTSCAQWLAQLLSVSQQKCALMGTLGVGFVDAMVETGFTTPQAVEVHRLLREVREQGAQAAAMEVSSHALQQGRVNGVAFDVALFTNLSRDHLDYHGDMASYEAAKTRLFTWHGLKAAVINLDDEAGQRMAQVAMNHGIQVIGYGFASPPQDFQLAAYLQASNMRAVAAHTEFELCVDGANYVIKSSLVGAFNVMNLLGVLGVMRAWGFEMQALIPLCADIKAAPGRMQRFGGLNQPLAVVDFAHTPDALEKTLHALAPIAVERGGRLMCVFGCGGDRDPGKRPQMGAVAARLSDCVYITSDNPRSEEPAEIVAQIVEGSQGGAQVLIEVDRRAAIASAIAHASAQDVVLIAGKGHEAYQEIKGVKYPYSDLTEVEVALTEWTKPS